MLKIVSENFTHALLLFLGLFLKISRWVPLQTLSTGVFRILHGRLPLRRLEFGKVHHLRIDIQLMTPRKSSTFLSLVLEQQSMKVVKPSSVSPLLVKRKAYALFSSPMLQRKCKYGVRCRLPSLSRNGQLIGFCQVLPIDRFNKTFKANNFYLRAMRTPLRPFTRKTIRKILKNPNVTRKLSQRQKSHENCSN